MLGGGGATNITCITSMTLYTMGGFQFFCWGCGSNQHNMYIQHNILDNVREWRGDNSHNTDRHITFKTSTKLIIVIALVALLTLITPITSIIPTKSTTITTLIVFI